MTYYDNPQHMMELIGGSFVRSLVACYYAADSKNKARLQEAFKEYFDIYEAQYKAWRASARLEGY